LPEPKGIPTFAEFAAVFWDWEKSDYLKERRKRRKLTQSYTDKNKKAVENILVPYFGNMKLDAITGKEIDTWLDYLISKKYKNSTANGFYGSLQTMLKWAVKKHIIERDPFNDVEKLMQEQKKKKIITPKEFWALFSDDWKKVWDNNFLMCTAHKLAGLTGIRCCEILGLKGEYVFDDHIYICAQYTEKMTEHYTHFDPMEFGDVPKIQAALLTGKPKEMINERPALSLVKMPIVDKTEKKKKGFLDFYSDFLPLPIWWGLFFALNLKNCTKQQYEYRLTLRIFVFMNRKNYGFEIIFTFG